MSARNCVICNRVFDGRGNKRFCGDEPCMRAADEIRKARFRGARRPPKPSAAARDPLVRAELAAFMEREEKRKAELHRQVQAKLERQGEVRSSDVIRYMLRGAA